MHRFSRWLEATAMSQELQQQIWLIELLQIVHILAVAAVLSAVLMVGLRIAGLRSTLDQTLVQTARRFMPWFWTALAVLAVSGAALILSEPRRTLDDNPAFQAKLAMLVLAVGAALWFERSLRRASKLWDDSVSAPILRRVMAVAGIVLACAIIVAGRWIAYMGTD